MRAKCPQTRKGCKHSVVETNIAAAVARDILLDDTSAVVQHFQQKMKKIKVVGALPASYNVSDAVMSIDGAAVARELPPTQAFKKCCWR